MTPYLGSILLCAFNFAPPGWAFCDGSLHPINTNEALFALLGTTYGGDGVTTFALPDLRGRIPIGFSVAHPMGHLGSLAGETVSVPTVGARPANPPVQYLGLNYIIALQGIFPPRS